MATITLKGNSIETIGELPEVGEKVPDFTLTATDLSDRKLADFTGKRIIFNIFPSLDTPVCAASIRKFNSEASALDNTAVLCISADLPFAHNRFCEAEGLNNVTALSTFRSPRFGEDYGVKITTGPLAGLLARAIVITDAEGVVRYTEQVPEIAQDPDFDAALAVLK